MTPDEQAIYRDYQKAHQRRELERDTLKLEPRYNFDEVEEQEYWRSVFGEVKPIIIEPESQDPFYIAPEKCTDEPDTQAQLIELEKYGYYFKSK